MHLKLKADRISFSITCHERFYIATVTHQQGEERLFTLLCIYLQLSWGAGQVFFTLISWAKKFVYTSMHLFTIELSGPIQVYYCYSISWGKIPPLKWRETNSSQLLNSVKSRKMVYRELEKVHPARGKKYSPFDPTSYLPL